MLIIDLGCSSRHTWEPALDRSERWKGCTGYSADQDFDVRFIKVTSRNCKKACIC